MEFYFETIIVGKCMVMCSTASPNIVLRFCFWFRIGRPFAVLVSELVGVGTPWLIWTNMVIVTMRRTIMVIVRRTIMVIVTMRML